MKGDQRDTSGGHTVEHPPGVQEVTGLIPTRDSDVFLCPMLVSCWWIHLSQKLQNILSVCLVSGQDNSQEI